MEQRKSARTHCRFRCELEQSLEQGAGTVLDISEGGLSVRTQLEVGQGEALVVRIRVPNEGKLKLETLVWHVREARRLYSAKPCLVLGLVLTKAPEAYFELLPRATRTEPAGPAPEAHKELDVEEDPPGLCAFRIRIKARSGPRTRVLSLSAESDDEARRLAVAKLGDDWDVIEIQRA